MTHILESKINEIDKDQILQGDVVWEMGDFAEKAHENTKESFLFRLSAPSSQYQFENFNRKWVRNSWPWMLFIEI